MSFLYAMFSGCSSPSFAVQSRCRISQCIPYYNVVVSIFFSIIPILTYIGGNDAGPRRGRPAGQRDCFFDYRMARFLAQ